MTAGDRESRETEGKPYGRALWPPETKAKLFAFVKETTAVVKATTGILEQVGSVKSDATIALYRRLARSRVQVTAKGAGRLMDGVTAQSWHTTRAAVLYQLADECRRWRGVTDRTLDLAEAVDAAKRARHAVLAYRQVLAMTRPEPEKPRRSKRSTLPRMRWQRVAFDAATRGNVPLWLLCGLPDAGPQRSSAGSRSGVMVMPWSSKYRARRSRQTRGNRSAGSPSIRPPKWAGSSR